MFFGYSPTNSEHLALLKVKLHCTVVCCHPCHPCLSPVQPLCWQVHPLACGT